jgi:hypothetical protein
MGAVSVIQPKTASREQMIPLLHHSARQSGILKMFQMGQFQMASPIPTNRRTHTLLAVLLR